MRATMNLDDILLKFDIATSNHPVRCDDDFACFIAQDTQADCHGRSPPRRMIGPLHGTRIAAVLHPLLAASFSLAKAYLTSLHGSV